MSTTDANMIHSPRIGISEQDRAAIADFDQAAPNFRIMRIELGVPKARRLGKLG